MSPATLQEAQRAAMKKLTMMDGVWRGPAWALRAGGEKHYVTQTERIGPFLDGTVRVVAGQPSQRIFEMDLVRVGDTDWPLGTPVPRE
jgi:hypothetical protein